MQALMIETQKYLNKYNGIITTSNAQQAADDFLANYSSWKNIIGYMIGGEDGEREYGNVLVVFSAAISEISTITKVNIDILIKEIQEYESKVKYMFEIKSVLYLY